jgi:hypothetical protein
LNVRVRMQNNADVFSRPVYAAIPICNKHQLHRRNWQEMECRKK